MHRDEPLSAAGRALPVTICSIIANGQAALVLMIKQTTLAQAGAASGAIEFIAVTDLAPAFAAFYGSVDELKHSSVMPFESGSGATSDLDQKRKPLIQRRQLRLNTIAPSGAMKNRDP